MVLSVVPFYRRNSQVNDQAVPAVSVACIVQPYMYVYMHMLFIVCFGHGFGKTLYIASAAHGASLDLYLLISFSD